MEKSHIVTYLNSENHKVSYLLSVDGNIFKKLKIVLSDLQLTDNYDLNVTLINFKLAKGKSSNILELYKESIHSPIEIHQVLDYNDQTKVCTYKIESSEFTYHSVIEDGEYSELDIVKKSIEYLIHELRNDSSREQSNFIEFKHVEPEFILKNGDDRIVVSINIEKLMNHTNIVSLNYNTNYKLYDIVSKNDTVDNIFDILFSGTGYECKSYDESRAIVIKDSVEYELLYRDKYYDIHNIFSINEYITFDYSDGIKLASAMMPNLPRIIDHTSIEV